MTVGTTVTRAVTVTGKGPKPLTVGHAFVEGGDGQVAVAAEGCAGKVLAPGATCTLTATFSATAPGDVGARIVVPSSASDQLAVRVTARGVRTAAIGQPFTVWTQPGPTPLDGTGTWLAVANDPVAGTGQVAPHYVYGLGFGFSSSSAVGTVGLVVAPTGRFAVLSVRAPDGKSHDAAVRLDWRAGRLYFPFVYQLGPGVWGGWIYDQTAGTWVAVGQLSLPTAWGKLAPTSVTTAAWFGPPAPGCAGYPLADVLFHPPIGYVGTASTIARLGSHGGGGGECPPRTSLEHGAWARYRLGAGG